MAIFQTRYNKLKKAITKPLKWFKQNYNEIIAVFTIILVLITWWSSSNQISLIKQDIEARNRPYLQIYNPTIKNNSNNTTCFIEVNVKNYGPIPAELVGKEFNFTLVEKKFNFTIGEHKGSCYSKNPITIYTDKSFKCENKSFFTVEMCEIAKNMEAELKLKYKIHNTNKIFEAYSKVKCTQDDPEERRDCFTLMSYTT